MNTKQRIKNLYNISPMYPRIPHLDKSISKMTHDDILLDEKIKYPIECYVQEKIDGANLGVSWYKNGPIVRNRNNILKKGYSEIRTPAKAQFKSTWNWVHDNRKDIEFVSKSLMSDVTIYGEWMFAQHSIRYDKLPDWFIAYDIWVVEEAKFLSPEKLKDILSKTNIKYVNPHKATLNSVDDVIKWSEMKSGYTNGIREGIVIKIVDGDFVENSYKIVNKHFNRREDFNENLIKNCLIK